MPKLSLCCLLFLHLQIQVQWANCSFPLSLPSLLHSREEQIGVDSAWIIYKDSLPWDSPWCSKHLLLCYPSPEKTTQH